MKKTILLILVLILLNSCSTSKPVSNGTRYFDENNREISESKFNRIRSTNELLDIPGDSSNHKRLTLRENRGRIVNRDSIEQLLEYETNRELDSDKPIVVIYYPGKDPCNSSGTTNRVLIENWYSELEAGLKEIAEVKPLYIYKDSDGLDKYNGIIKWHKDPERTFEKTFFKYHYPCSSFVVISKDGDYISWYGEFGKPQLLKATKKMK